jgi:hypothetical protein
VYIIPLAELELANAAQLGLFRKEVQPTEAPAAAAAFRADLQRYLCDASSYGRGICTRKAIGISMDGPARCSQSGYHSCCRGNRFFAQTHSVLSTKDSPG